MHFPSNFVTDRQQPPRSFQKDVEIVDHLFVPEDDALLAAIGQFQHLLEPFRLLTSL